MFFTYALYVAAVGFLGISFLQDDRKTKVALKKSWKAFENILPPVSRGHRACRSHDGHL